MRFCFGMVSLAASICFAYGAYLRWFNHNLIRGLGGNKSEFLGVTLPYPIMMSLLVVLCLISAFTAVYAFFFPASQSIEPEP
jgi:hypothetical protein